jgi:hypothetical protein
MEFRGGIDYGLDGKIDIKKMEWFMPNGFCTAWICLGLAFDMDY